MWKVKNLQVLALVKSFPRSDLVSKLASKFSSTTISTNCERSSEWDLAKPFSEIPSLPMLPILGTAWHFMPYIGKYDLQRQHLANREKRRLLGDVFREKIGYLDIVITFRAEDFQTVFLNEGVYPHRIEFSSLKAYRESRKDLYPTNGLLAINGKEWSDLRKYAQKHLLRPYAALSYLNGVHNVSKEFVQGIHEKLDNRLEVPQFMNELYKWALESIYLVGLNTRLGCFDKNLSPDSDALKMINSVLTQFECMNSLEAFSGNIQFWKLFPTPTWKRFVQAADVYTDIAFKHIQQTLEHLEKPTEENDNSIQPTYLVNLLKEGIDVKSAMVIVSDLLMAGIETTSHAAGFLLYYLAQNPNKQEKLYEEVQSLLPSADTCISAPIYNQLKYAKACLKETLRLKTVVGGTVRTMQNDVVINGYQVPAGTMVAVAYQEMCLNEKYHKYPNEFIPERWMDRSQRTHPHALLPFGAGARACIGRRIAQQEIISLVAEIIKKYKLEYYYDDIDVLTKMISVPDKPLKITFVKR